MYNIESHDVIVSVIYMFIGAFFVTYQHTKLASFFSNVPTSHLYSYTCRRRLYVGMLLHWHVTKNETSQRHNVPTSLTQCKDGVYYACIFRRHTNVPMYHRTLVFYNKRACLVYITLTRSCHSILYTKHQQYISTTYIGLILGTRCCL